MSESTAIEDMDIGAALGELFKSLSRDMDTLVATQMKARERIQILEAEVAELRFALDAARRTAC